MTAAPERGDKYQVKLKPLSGAAIWLQAPIDKRGFPDGGDLHLTIERAEEVVMVLMQGIEDARALQSEDAELSALGASSRPCEVPEL